MALAKTKDDLVQALSSDPVVMEAFRDILEAQKEATATRGVVPREVLLNFLSEVLSATGDKIIQMVDADETYDEDMKTHGFYWHAFGRFFTRWQDITVRDISDPTQVYRLNVKLPAFNAFDAFRQAVYDGTNEVRLPVNTQLKEVQNFLKGMGVDPTEAGLASLSVEDLLKSKKFEIVEGELPLE